MFSLDFIGNTRKYCSNDRRRKSNVGFLLWKLMKSVILKQFCYERKIPNPRIKPRTSCSLTIGNLHYTTEATWHMKARISKGVAEHNYMKYRFIKRSRSTEFQLGTLIILTTFAIHYTTGCKENLQHHLTVSTKLEYTNIVKARSQPRSTGETRKLQSSFFQVFPAPSFRIFPTLKSGNSERCTSKELAN